MNCVTYLCFADESNIKATFSTPTHSLRYARIEGEKEKNGEANNSDAIAIFRLFSLIFLLSTRKTITQGVGTAAMLMCVANAVDRERCRCSFSLSLSPSLRSKEKYVDRIDAIFRSQSLQFSLDPAITSRAARSTSAQVFDIDHGIILAH